MNTDQMALIQRRIGNVSEQIEGFHPLCARRHAMDARRDVLHRLAGAVAYDSGEYDATYYSGSGFDLTGWRAHYADECLRDALHYLVWAEVHSGILTRDEAFEADPFNRRKVVPV